MNDYEALGGEPALRRIIDAFIARVSSDFIVGFFFERVNLERVRAREFELASAHLGGPHSYTGRAMRPVHGAYPINAGHFRRRIAILRTVLKEQDVPQDISQRWIEHDLALESQVTDGSECAQ